MAEGKAEGFQNKRLDRVVADDLQIVAQQGVSAAPSTSCAVAPALRRSPAQTARSRLAASPRMDSGYGPANPGADGNLVEVDRVGPGVPDSVDLVGVGQEVTGVLLRRAQRRGQFGGDVGQGDGAREIQHDPLEAETTLQLTALDTTRCR